MSNYKNNLTKRHLQCPKGVPPGRFTVSTHTAHYRSDLKLWESELQGREKQLVTREGEVERREREVRERETELLIKERALRIRESVLLGKERRHRGT